MPGEKLAELFPNVIEVRFNQNPLGLDEATGKWIENFDWEDMKWCDMVLMNNISNFGGAYTARVCGKAKEMDKIFVYDTDDLLTQLYKGHRLEKVYEEGLSDTTKFIYYNSDIITVTQKKFAERIKPFVGNGILAVVKNAIDYDLPAWNMDRVESPGVCRFGWAGGIHHEEDVKEFLSVPAIVNQKVGHAKVKWDFYGRPPIEQFPLPPKGAFKLPNVDLRKKKYFEHPEITSIVDAYRLEHQHNEYELGRVNDWMTKVVKWEKDQWQQDVWRNYEKRLMAYNKGTANYSIYFALPADRYGVFYSNMDVALAPLQMNEFNDSKSDIKIAECGRYKVPLVASNVGCYDEIIVNGENGYLIDPDEGKHRWKEILVKLAREPKTRQRMGEALHETTEEMFNINKVGHHRLEVYKEFLKWQKTVGEVKGNDHNDNQDNWETDASELSEERVG